MMLASVSSFNRLVGTNNVKLTYLSMYKALNNETPEYLSSEFIKRMDITSYEIQKTNWRYIFHVPNISKGGSVISGAVLWNSLPGQFRQASLLASL